MVGSVRRSAEGLDIPLDDDESDLIYLRQQRTLADVARVQGFGYWSGHDVNVEFHPAPPHSGIVFVRSDLDFPRKIPATVQHRIEVPRRTNLTADGTTVEMVEHIMAALAGMCVDNCEVWVDAQEMPGCDGSSKAFVDAILKAGIVEQEAQQPRIVVTEVTRVGDQDCWVEARPSPTNAMSVKYRLEFSENVAIGRQTLELDVTTESFQQELSSARTFLLKAEAEWLQQQGMGARVTHQDLLIYDEEGPIDNELRFEDECVRHKTLDLIGDLALAGCDLAGRFIAHRSGHRLNAELVNVLLAEEQIIETLRRTA